jgi:hypothetical protein
VLIASMLGSIGEATAQEQEINPGERRLTGFVQNQDLRRVSQATVEVRDQEGHTVARTVTDEAGEFSVTISQDSTVSVSAVLDTYRSQYVVITKGAEQPTPIRLTLAQTEEIALDIVSPLAPIQYKASSETYAVSRKDIEELPRGNNNELHDVLLTVPSAVYGALKQVHIRQDHANIQFRIDGVPIPETVSTTFFRRHYAASLGAGGHYPGGHGGPVWK